MTTEAIKGAQLMVVLVQAGDETDLSLQSETRTMLRNCWENTESRIAVVAPAVGAIPRALRNQGFVTYYPHDEARPDSWHQPAVVDAFSARLLRTSAATAGPDAMSDAEIKEWRNRLVHINADSMSDDSRERNLAKLRVDRDELADAVTAQTSSGIEEHELRERLLDRALLATALGDNRLVTDYYALLNRSRSAPPADEVPRPRSDDHDAEGEPYQLGLVALEAGDVDRAVRLFELATYRYEQRYGPDHPTTIAALYNLALGQSQQSRPTPALASYTEAFARARATLGDHHPQTAAIAVNLAAILERRGEPAEARALLELAARAYRAVRPGDSPELAGVLSRLDVLDRR